MHALDRELTELIDAAREVQGTFSLSLHDHSAASVGAALRAGSGAIHTGVCFDVSCGIGFCAEHAAVAEMLKSREIQIAAIVAVDSETVVSPCGRCRELVAQLCPENAHTQVILPGDQVVPLRELLPKRWPSW